MMPPLNSYERRSNSYNVNWVPTSADIVHATAEPRLHYHADGADSADDYVQVELERRMWSSTSADISRATDSTDRVATCAICLDEMDHVSCVTFPCGHSLHKSCAQTSEKYSILDNGCYLCPECRYDVSFLRVIFISSDHEVWRTDTSSSSSAVAFATNFSTVEAAAELSASGGNNQMVISSHSPPVQHLPSPDLWGQSQTRSQPSQQMPDIIMVSNSVSATGSETNNLATTQDHHHQQMPAAIAAFATGGLGLVGAGVGGAGAPRRASGLQSQFNLLKSNVAFWDLFQEMLDASPELYALGPDQDSQDRSAATPTEAHPPAYAHHPPSEPASWGAEPRPATHAIPPIPAVPASATLDTSDTAGDSRCEQSPARARAWHAESDEQCVSTARTGQLATHKSRSQNTSACKRTPAVLQRRIKSADLQRLHSQTARPGLGQEISQRQRDRRQYMLFSIGVVSLVTGGLIYRNVR